MREVVVIACRNTLTNKGANTNWQPACQQDAQTPRRVLYSGRNVGKPRETLGG
jgi:hypothetical protein